MTIAARIVVLALLIISCGCGRRLSDEEQQQLARLKRDLDSIRTELAAGKIDQMKYSGGLLKALLDVRMEVLKTNEALLEQRVNAIESGAKVTVVVSATKDDPIRAAQLEKELELQRGKLAEEEVKAARYSGGLLQAMALMSAATVRNTVAMLEQQYLIAKYGLTLPVPAATK